MQLADSNTGEREGYLYNNGLSPLGRSAIAEMNRLGMMVDLSHPAKGANLEAIRWRRCLFHHARSAEQRKHKQGEGNNLPSPR